jgi:hypothetical protein
MPIFAFVMLPAMCCVSPDVVLIPVGMLLSGICVLVLWVALPDERTGLQFQC